MNNINEKSIQRHFDFIKKIESMDYSEQRKMLDELIEDYKELYPNKEDRFFDSYEAFSMAELWKDGIVLVIRAVSAINKGYYKVGSNKKMASKFNSLFQIINEIIDDDAMLNCDLVSAYAESQTW